MQHYAWLRLKQFLKCGLNHVNQLTIASFCACKIQVPFLGVALHDQVPFFPPRLSQWSPLSECASIKAQDPQALCHQSQPVCRSLAWPPYVKMMCKVTSLIYLIHVLFDIWHTPLTCLSLPAVSSISPATSATIKHIHFGVTSVQQIKVLDREK